MPLSELLFEADDNAVDVLTMRKVQQAMAAFEPGILVRNLQPLPNKWGDGIAGVEIDYIRTDAPQSPAAARHASSAVVRVGGRVDVVVR